MEGSIARLDGLPAHVATVLSDFAAKARDVLADELVSVVLFGSAAEGRLRATSDVNLILVLRSFDPEKLGQLGDPLLAADAAIQLRVMFLLESEIPAAVECFAQKFADILRRHRVIFGRQVFAATKVPRNAEIFRLRQILLNLTLRLREAYVSRGQRAEQIVRVLADALGPLRATAGTLLELEGAPNPDSDAALKAVAASFGAEGEAAAAGLLAAHEGRAMAEPQRALVQVVDLVTRIAARTAQLS
jgi:predicted nucleotidyltransferase